MNPYVIGLNLRDGCYCYKKASKIPSWLEDGAQINKEAHVGSKDPLVGGL